MSLINYLRGAVLGAALAFSCGPKEGFSRDEQAEETLEVMVQRDVTDSNGLAFDGAQQILVQDNKTPITNEEVTLYSVISQGDVYLTEANGGGIALFPESRRRHGRSSRELNVNVPQPVQGSSESLLSGLLRWSLTDFSCVSAESVPANGVPRVIIYSDENGRQVAFGGDYSRLQFDSPAQFYSFDPMGEGVPLLIPDAIARAVFSESLYERIREECRGSSSASCSGEVLFEDEFEGKELDGSLWETNLVNNGKGVLRYNDGILEIPTGRGGTSILQSRSRYNLSDGPLCFEARWRVREREGTASIARLGFLDKGIGVGYILWDNELTCDNTSSESCSDYQNCDVSVEEYHDLNVVMDSQRALFTIDGEKRLINKECIPDSSSLAIELTCQSQDNDEKVCFFDYVRLLR